MAISSEQAPPVETEVKEAVPVTDSAAGTETADPMRWKALLVLLVAAFLDMLDSTVANVAAPSMQRSLAAGYSAIQWVLVGYQLSFALSLILGGRLGDILGRKKVFLLGVAGFTLASLASGASQEPWQLVAARCAQGAFAGVMVPQVMSILHVTFSGKEKGAAFAMYGTVSGLAATIGLAAGGLMVDWDLFGLGWRVIFLVNVPIGIVGLIYGAKVIRESKAPHALKLDTLGLVLATGGLVMFVYPLLQGRENGWPVAGFVSMALSVPVLIGFVLLQRRKIDTGGSPLVELGLFKVRSFASGLSVNLIFYIGVGLFNIAWTLHMQIGQGWSPVHAGLTSLFFCVGAFFASTLSLIVLVPKFGRPVLHIGAVVMGLGLLGYIWAAGHFGSEVTTWEIGVPLFLIGVGFGAVATPLPVIVVTDVPHKDAGSASGLVHTDIQLGFAIGGALISIVFFGGLASNTAASVDEVTPKLRQDLVATASVDPGQVDSVLASYRTCQVDRAKEKDPTTVPASCVSAPALQDTKVAGVLAGYNETVTGDSFARSLQTTLWTFGGILVVVFLLMFAIPKQAAAQEFGEDEAAPEATAVA
ncbi:MFS transporter [Kitasatospora sp. NPDC101183]|uniref:MFS transporter n=1 Tax=Kitasatospora sp. NPDC101183 TaxID=3364100 RepID=UPI0037FCB1B3